MELFNTCFLYWLHLLHVFSVTINYMNISAVRAWFQFVLGLYHYLGTNSVLSNFFYIFYDIIIYTISILS